MSCVAIALIDYVGTLLALRKQLIVDKVGVVTGRSQDRHSTCEARAEDS
jgi:hypothetical protein